MKIKPNYQIIDKKLMRGTQLTSPLKLLRLKKLGVNQVIDLRKTDNYKSFLEKIYCKILNLKYINCPSSFRDNSMKTKRFFQKINEIITKNEGITYIHCKKGKHRTGLCVAAYEKEVLNKSNPEIIYNLYNDSFDDLLKNKRLSLTNALKNFAKIFDLK